MGAATSSAETSRTPCTASFHTFPRSRSSCKQLHTQLGLLALSLDTYTTTAQHALPAQHQRLLPLPGWQLWHRCGPVCCNVWCPADEVLAQQWWPLRTSHSWPISWQLLVLYCNPCRPLLAHPPAVSPMNDVARPAMLQHAAAAAAAAAAATLKQVMLLGSNMTATQAEIFLGAAVHHLLLCLTCGRTCTSSKPPRCW
jgi:hypothetical protein